MEKKMEKGKNMMVKGKLYINNKLEYDGEYLYRKKWNGKGYDDNLNIIYELINGNGPVKEYGWNGKLEFDGEYLNGKRNGKGKEYDIYFGNLIFEGGYLNGKRNGKGKEFNDNEKLIYEGNYLNGKWNKTHSINNRKNPPRIKFKFKYLQ